MDRGLAQAKGAREFGGAHRAAVVWERVQQGEGLGYGGGQRRRPAVEQENLHKRADASAPRSMSMPLPLPLLPGSTEVGGDASATLSLSSRPYLLRLTQHNR